VATLVADLARDLRWALDPVAFAVEGLGFTPDPWQARALRSPVRRALWNVSRQLGKSTTAAALALHATIYTPRALVLLLSPSLRQSSELFRKVSDFTDALAVHPTLTEDNRLSMALDNGGRVVSLPSSQGTVRGYSAVTLVVEDEASQVPDDLHAAVRPMLAVSNGRMILMSSPYGQRGHFYLAWRDGGPDWERVEVPARECPRISPEFLAAERKALGESWYAQEYECRFVETLQTVFGMDLLRAALSPDVPPDMNAQERADLWKKE
jgi:hypothetical protein